MYDDKTKQLIEAIKQLNEEELKIIKNACSDRQDVLALNIAKELRLGDLVQFEGKYNRTVIGIVNKINRKSIGITEKDNALAKWRVHPSFVTKVVA